MQILGKHIDFQFLAFKISDLILDDVQVNSIYEPNNVRIYLPSVHDE